MDDPGRFDSFLLWKIIAGLFVSGLVVILLHAGNDGLLPSTYSSNTWTKTQDNSSRASNRSYNSLQEKSVLEKLLLLSQVRGSERSSILRQFEYQIPVMQQLCSDASTQTDIGDMIVVVYEISEESGLDRYESLPY